MSGHASAPSNDSRMAPMTESVAPRENPFAATALWIDDTCPLHQFSMHKCGCGPRSFDDYCAYAYFTKWLSCGMELNQLFV